MEIQITVIKTYYLQEVKQVLSFENMSSAANGAWFMFYYSMLVRVGGVKFNYNFFKATKLEVELHSAKGYFKSWLLKSVILLQN